MNAKHTPGPWTAIRDEAHRRVVVRAGLTPLAEMWMVGQPDEQRMTDARLIAEAPELLKACRSLVADELTAEQLRNRISAARLVIARATGADA